MRMAPIKIKENVGLYSCITIYAYKVNGDPFCF